MPQPQEYNPLNPTPYQAVQAPEMAPPTPSPLPAQGPEINGAVGRSGAMATIADGMLRGFMQGKAMVEAKKAMQLKAKSDNLLASYNQDAQRLVQMTQAGVDPNSQEFKTAQAAVQGSWGAWMDFMGQHVDQQQAGKKGGKGKRMEEGLMGMFRSGDPMQVSRAWYNVAKQAGPPVMGQIAMLNTPEAKAARQAQAQTAQNAVAATQLQAGTLQHQQALQTAQAKVDELNKIPRNQWTPAQQQQYEQAAQVLTPVQVLKPGEEAQRAVDEIVRRMEEDPSYKLTDHDKSMFEAAGIHIDPKKRTSVTARGEIIQTDEDGNYEILRGPQKEYEPRGGSGGRGGAGGNAADKAFAKWDAYYKAHYPNLSDDERTALVERKVEGISQHQAGEIQYDAITEPRKFDNEVLTTAINRLQSLPEYKNVQNFSDILANLVGQDETGYAYNRALPKARPDGDYSGNPKAQKVDLQKLDRDLQEQIRAVLNDPRNGLSQNEKRAAMARMRPLYGPAARPPGSGTPSAPPPTPAAQPAAAASSQPPHGSTPSQGPTPYMVIAHPKGLVEPGNLTIWNRPTVHNADGTHSSEYSVSFQDDKGREVLVPTVVHGRFLTPDGKKPPEGSAEEKAMFRRAWDHYLKTGENLGKFDNSADADAYAKILHSRGSHPRGNGGHTKGVVRKSAFLKANPHATAADWDEVKPQLKNQGYDVEDN